MRDIMMFSTGIRTNGEAGGGIFRRFPTALLTICLASNVFAQKLPASKGAVPDGVNPYYSVQRIIIKGGISVDRIIIAGPPKPPPGIERAELALPEPYHTLAVNTLGEVPAFDWSFGCSTTSAAMIAGYYDRHGYEDMYTGPTNGGVMPLDNSSWPSVLINGETRKQCPLSATRDGLDGRITRGHVDDYWVKYNEKGPDPFVTNGWTEHTLENCTADFMKTNKWIVPDPNGFNVDGGTTFYSYNSNAPLPSADMESFGIQNKDGGYGIKLFYESRGYTVAAMYNQRIYGYNSISAGFTFAQFKSEIDAGRPVMIHVTGHTMVGVGYDDATNLVYLHDTWDYNTHSMTWGGSYSGMTHWGVTIVQLAEPEIDIRGDGHSIPDGDTTPNATDLTDFGTVNVGDEATHVFTIHNTGAFTLNLTGSPAVQISGSADFTVVSQPSATLLPPGASTAFSVHYDPSVASPQTATITVPSTDLNENPYNFSLQGNGGDQFVLVGIKTYLEGPYQAGGSMTTALNAVEYIPTTSPFADVRTAVAVPPDVVDWISVELRSSESGPSVVQRSFFLKSNGFIVDTDGTTADLPVPGVTDGSYFVLVLHRNHLAVMSASALSLNASSAAAHDFTSGLGQYYGTDSNRAKEVETGVWGMPAGDADGSGTVDASDRSATWNERNQSDYLDADCDLSGTVDASDRSITWNNRNKSTSVP
jgi:hypothetical protein